jgi:hypothetical protein
MRATHCCHVEHSVRFEAFMAVTMKNAIFWDVAVVRIDVLLKRSYKRHVGEDGIHVEHPQ